VRSTRGDRVIAAPDLFVTHLTTSLEPDELLTEIVVPVPAPGTGSAFVEFARRHGDFALGGAAVLLTPGAGGRVASASLALLAAAPVPLRVEAAERALADRVPDEAAAREAAALAVADVRPTGDIHGSSDYRRGLIEALVRRAILAAAERIREAA
jgi:CO/xanthine dehydrogenase FAD-binding subunit